MDTAELERVRNLTENFNALQGLRIVAFSAGFAGMQFIELYCGDSGWSVLGVVPLLLGFIAAFVYVPRYYVSRFGWVQHSQQPASITSLQIVIGIVLICQLFMLADLFQHALRVPADFWTLAVSILALCVLLSPSAARRPPPATVMVFAVAALALGQLAVLPLWISALSLGPSLNSHQIFLWKVTSRAGVWVLLIILGVYDHYRLVQQFRPRPSGSALV